MSVALSEQMSLSVDVSIALKKRVGTQPEAVINRELVRLLLAIRDTASMQEACDQVNFSPRYAQRMLKRFTDGSGIKLLRHRGWQGTNLSEEGFQCIALYVAALQCVEQLVKEHELPRALPPLEAFPSNADWNNREL